MQATWLGQSLRERAFNIAANPTVLGNSGAEVVSSCTPYRPHSYSFLWGETRLYSASIVGGIRMEEARSPLRIYLVLAVLVVLVLAFAAIAYEIQLPKPVPRSIDGYYNYEPAWGITSTYTLVYHIPNPVNVSQTQSLSVLFNATKLVGQTQSVEVHSLNVTILASSGNVLFTTVLREDKELKAGESWGPKQVVFMIDNRTVQIGPGSQTTAEVLISVTFDEIAALPLSPHYSKTATVPTQQIVVCSPYAALTRTYEFNWQESVVTAALIGGLFYVCYGFVSIVSRLPRPDRRLPSGFRDARTGRAVGTWSAYKAILSVVVGLAFVMLANFGMPAHQIDLMKLITDLFLGRLDIEVFAAVGSWIVGLLLNRI